jgi:hypothetical protein
VSIVLPSAAVGTKPDGIATMTSASLSPALASWIGAPAGTTATSPAETASAPGDRRIEPRTTMKTSSRSR